MDNQHRKISGYRELTAVEIDLINRIKAKGQELGDLLEEVGAHLDTQRERAEGDHDIEEKESFRLQRAEPRRWAAMARTSFQLGTMQLVRAVAQPEDGL